MLNRRKTPIMELIGQDKTIKHAKKGGELFNYISNLLYWPYFGPNRLQFHNGLLFAVCPYGVISWIILFCPPYSYLCSWLYLWWCGVLWRFLPHTICTRIWGTITNTLYVTTNYFLWSWYFAWWYGVLTKYLFYILLYLLKKSYIFYYFLFYTFAWGYTTKSDYRSCNLRHLVTYI